MNLNGTSLTNFIDLSDNNKLMVLDWRNNEDVRKWMYNSDPISKEEHFAFINTLKINKTKLYYLVSHKENSIGVIYFTDIDSTSKSAEFGIYSNPYSKGNGKILMDCICEYGFNILNLHKIVAEVFANNQRAINLYHHFNFNKIGENLLNNKKVIYMELKNEHR
ncbi:MAG: UDP-4-amino-4,6-dideoxy-N-acetyl-beta-L-altrosamine N-acetyltransferase [Sulfurimonadaceae bacterium]